jgi:hypothetical protein
MVPTSTLERHPKTPKRDAAQHLPSIAIRDQQDARGAARISVLEGEDEAMDDLVAQIANLHDGGASAGEVEQDVELVPSSCL